MNIYRRNSAVKSISIARMLDHFGNTIVEALKGKNDRLTEFIDAIDTYIDDDSEENREALEVAGGVLTDPVKQYLRRVLPDFQMLQSAMRIAVQNDNAEFPLFDLLIDAIDETIQGGGRRRTRRTRRRQGK
jgi:hypothetical protein